MKVTNDMIALISNRFRDPKKRKINQSQLADHMGLGKAWVSKLMTGRLLTVTDEQVEMMEEFLEIRLSSFSEKRKTPAVAVEIARKMQESEPISRIVAALLEIDVPTAPPATRWIEPCDMTRIGGEIIKIAQANPDKPGKVAKLVLQLLA